MSQFEEQKPAYGFYPKEGAWISVKNPSKKFSSLSGRIDDIRIKTVEPPEGKDWDKYEALQIILRGEHTIIIKMNVEHNPARTFLMALPNVDPRKDVKLIIFSNEKKYDSIMIEQDDIRHKYYYTKSDPKGKPDWIKTDKGWDKSAETAFFKHSVHEFMARIRNASPQNTAPPKDNWSNEQFPDDDLPF